MNPAQQRERLDQAVSDLATTIVEIVVERIEVVFANRADIVAQKMIDPMVSKAEVAKYLKISIRSVENWMEHYKVPYYKIGRSVRFKLSDVEAHLATARIGARR